MFVLERTKSSSRTIKVNKGECFKIISSDIPIKYGVLREKIGVFINEVDYSSCSINYVLL